MNVNLNWWNVCIFCAVVYMPRCHQLTDSGDMHICFDFVLTVCFSFFPFFFCYLSARLVLHLFVLAWCSGIMHHNYKRARAPHLFSSMPAQLTDNHNKVYSVSPCMCAPLFARMLKRNTQPVARTERQMNEQIFSILNKVTHFIDFCIRLECCMGA